MKKATVFMRVIAAALVPLVVVLFVNAWVFGSVSRRTAGRAAEYSAKTQLNSVSVLIEERFSYIENLGMSHVNRMDGILSAIKAMPDSRDAGVNDGGVNTYRRVVQNTASGLLGSVANITDVWYKLSDETLFGDEDCIGLYLKNEFGDSSESNPGRVVSDPNFNAWYDYARSSGKVYVSRVRPSSDGREYLCSMIFPVRFSGKVIGCMGVDISYNEISSLVSNLFYSENRYNFAVLTDDGNLVYPVRSRESAPDYSALLRERARLISKHPNSGYEEFIHIDYYSPVWNETSAVYIEKARRSGSGSASGILLLISVPHSDLYAQQANTDAMLVVFDFVSLIVIGLISAFASYTVVKPIKAITRVADKIADGDEDEIRKWLLSLGELQQDGARFEEVTNSRDEIVRLDYAVKRMTEKIMQNAVLREQVREAEEEKLTVQADSEMKMRFFASMSHEIRTPMNSILGMTQLLAQEKSLSDTQREYISNIKVSANSLLVTINDILDLSKLEDGRMQMSPVNFSIDNLISSVDATIRPLAAKKGLDFIIEKTGVFYPALFGDDNRVRQVLVNLLGNAVKFTEIGKVELLVSGELVPDEFEGERDSANCVIFTVKDSGIGIRKEDMPNLFTPFAPSAKTFGGGTVNSGLYKAQVRHATGTGLGLSITKSIVSLMNGEISASGTYGQGTTFTVKIPMPAGDATRVVDRVISGDNADNFESFFAPDAAVLVVDDNEINLNVAGGILKTLYKIDADTALSGKEALAMVSHKKYDIIFMDHMMPEMDGIETTARIREMGGDCAKLPIIALTANAVIGAREMLLDTGMNDFISKPIQQNELCLILSRWLPKEKAIVKKETDGGSDLFTALAKLPQLDLKKGLATFGGDERQYKDSLLSLCEIAESQIRAISKHLAEKQMMLFKAQIHGIKSTLAGLGAMSLAKMALRLEQESGRKNIEYCRDNFTAFSERLTALCDDIKFHCQS